MTQPRRQVFFCPLVYVVSKKKDIVTDVSFRYTVTRSLTIHSIVPTTCSGSSETVTTM